MHERDTGQFAIFIENGDGRADRDFLVTTENGEEARTARKVTGLNAEMERDNPRSYAHGRRYYYLAADLAVARGAAAKIPQVLQIPGSIAGSS